MWSHEVSQMVGSMNQQAMAQNLYANSIGSMSPSMQAHNLTGTAFSTMGAVAAPVAAMGMGLAGIDPLSLAFKGFMGSAPTAGLGGGLAAGFAMAAPVAIGMYGASLAGQQVMMGAQQQSNLHAMLRTNFGGMMNGGVGFRTADSNFLGQQIRQMTHQVGPGGDFQTFNELSGLMGNMGKMGFASQVSDVRQFAQKFKEMVSTLKTVARELGTSLESAQEMIVGMRGSGIFNASDQLKMSGLMRQGAVAGNISTQDSMMMQGIGAQIGRSIGGRGRGGAFAGVRTINQVGMAVQSGTLTEEDIFNATGLTGAEGQRAYASSMLESSARFLKTGRGRFLTASLAGDNGQINQSALDEFMSGGFGVGRTGQLARSNLRRMGPAHFMRNEGRYRESVLEAVGGNTNVLALMGWANERGIDIGSMGDRESIFAGRMLGMDRNSLEDAIRMAKNYQRDSGLAGMRSDRDKYLQSLQMQRRGYGAEGVKNSFNQFRERLQGSLQEVGQKMYSDASSYVEKVLADMAGEVSEALTEDVEKSYMEFVRTGGQGGGMRSMSGGLHASKAFGGSSLGTTQSSWGNWQKRGQGAGLMGSLSRAFGGKTIEEQTGRYYRVNPTASGGDGAYISGNSADREFMRQLANDNAKISGARSGIDANVAGLIKSMSGVRLGEDMSRALSTTSGTAYEANLEKLIMETGSPELRARYGQLIERSGSGDKDALRELGQIYQGVSTMVGGKGQSFLDRAGRTGAEGGLRGKYGTEEERLTAYANELGRGRANKADATLTASFNRLNESTGGALESVIGSIPGLGGLAYSSKTVYEGYMRSKPTEGGDDQVTQAMARMMRTKAGRNIAAVGFAGNATDAQLTELEARRKDLTGTDSSTQAERELVNRSILAAKYKKSGKLSRGDIETYLGAGVSDEDAMARLQSMANVYESDTTAQMGELAERYGSMARTRIERYGRKGLFKGGRFVSGLKGASAAYMSEFMKGEEQMAAAGFDNPDGIMTGAKTQADAALAAYGKMSDQQLNAEYMALRASGTDEAQMALSGMSSIRNLRRQYTRGGRGSMDLGMARVLGISGMTREEQIALRGAKGVGVFESVLKNHGVELSAGQMEELADIRKNLSVKGITNEDKTKELQRLSSLSTTVQDQQREQRKKNQEQSDPLLAEIRDGINKLIEVQNKNKQTSKPTEVRIVDGGPLASDIANNMTLASGEPGTG